MSDSCMAETRDLARAWQAVLGQLELELARPNFETFLRGTRPLCLEGDTLTVEATRLNVEQLNGTLRTSIERATYHKFGRELCVVFVPRGAGSVQPGPGDGGRDEAGGRSDAAALVGRLNRWFTFDRYIPAQGNRMALSCCQDILAEPGFRMTPVVIYGRPGLGKTHLLHAMAQEAAAHAWPVACLSAEEFTTRFTRSLRDGALEGFQGTMRSVRLLLIDDLQDFAGRKATQEELVHTIDSVLNAGGCVVAASEEHPCELNLPERLASRLSSGVAARILPFMAEERRRYVELLSREHGAALPGWAIDRIVGIEAPSVRVLQGAVNGAIQLQRCGMLDLARLDTELTRIAVVEATTGAFGERELLDMVARHFELCFDDLVGQSRKPVVTQARAIAVAALQERGKSLSQIGALLGGRHRATVLELGERGKRLLESDPSLRARLAG